MNLTEYNKVKDLNYYSYCDYLQEKYGIGRDNYFSKSWNKSKKVTRTKDGLYVHHKMEDRGYKLADPEFAKIFPVDYQAAENLVYCDYLEHVLLHLLICEMPEKPQKPEISGDSFNALVLGTLDYEVGVTGLRKMMIPELNDFYSGWRPTVQWKVNCFARIENDKDVFLDLIRRFKKMYPIEDCLSSYNAHFGSWSDDKNKALYKELENL